VSKTTEWVGWGEVGGFRHKAPGDATPPNFVEKTFANTHKTGKFAKVPHYTVFFRQGLHFMLTRHNTCVHQSTWFLWTSIHM